MNNYISRFYITYIDLVCQVRLWYKPIWPTYVQDPGLWPFYFKFHPCKKKSLPIKFTSCFQYSCRTINKKFEKTLIRWGRSLYIKFFWNCRAMKSSFIMDLNMYFILAIRTQFQIINGSIQVSLYFNCLPFSNIATAICDFELYGRSKIHFYHLTYDFCNCHIEILNLDLRPTS